MNKIYKVISVCTKRDIEVWKITSQHLIKYVHAESYSVIVPNDDVDLFKKNTPTRINVISENIYVEEIKKYLIDKIPEIRRNEFGWYLQQFIKLIALHEVPDNKLGLIWDADTVPLKKLYFQNTNNQLLYYYGTELHKPYFDFIERLLNIQKITEYSFVAQCFVIYGNWIKKLSNEIECEYSKNWIKAIIDNIDFNQYHAFSEYELLGTYISNKYSTDLVFKSKKWLRSGNGLLGSVKNINSFPFFLVKYYYDYISFENWDQKFNIFRKFFNKINFLLYLYSQKKH